ncbi:hypothetical protein [Streptomyces sp. NPDC051577]|uniref:hypothetical protein n=1 Tax=Streptomyces sp. NPDC051577 TaxID=3155166 RepID=UPI003422371D
MSPERREAICAWLIANDIDLAEILINAQIIEDQTAGIIRYDVRLREPHPDGVLVERLPNGQRVIATSVDPRRETREVPLLVPASDRFPA